MEIEKLVRELCEEWEWDEKQILSFLRKKNTRTIAEFLGITSGEYSSKFTVEIGRAIEEYFLNKGFPLLKKQPNLHRFKVIASLQPNVRSFTKKKSELF